ncbi:integrase, partial [Acinetobacter baumannii]
MADLAWEPEGVVVTLTRSKTDQDGQGIIKAIPYGEGLCCPATALRTWLDAAHITAGALFRSVTRWDEVGGDAL